MTIYNLGNIKGEKGDKGDSITGATGPVGVGIKSIEQITHKKFKFCLTDGSEYIIDYDTGSFDGMVVVCDKSILSAADGEFATVSAQLTSGGFPVPFAGELITFEVRKQSDDSLVETLTDTTDGTGKASVEYFGSGVGDLNIKVKCRSFIETYDVEDNILWKPDVSTIPVTSKTIRMYDTTESRLCLDNPIDLPSSFVITGTIKRVGSSAQQVLIGCGVDKDNMYEFPVLKSTGNMTLRNNINGASLIDEYAFGTNIDVPFSYTYDGNGNHTLCVNNISRTVTSSAISMDKFISLQLNSNGRLSNLKIKPL